MNDPMHVALYAVMFLWGIAVKYWPKLAGIPNNLIPWLNTAIGVLAQLVVPGAAHAATGPMPAVVIASGFWGAFVGIATQVLTPVLVAGVAAAKTSIAYRVFGEHAVEKWMGMKPVA